MLIRTTGEVAPNIYLITLGTSCSYVAGRNSLTMFDACLSAQVPIYLKRLNSIGLILERVSTIFITHLHADRIGAIPYFRKVNPHIKLITTPLVESELHKFETIERIFNEDKELSSKILSKETTTKLSLDEYKELFSVSSTVHEGDLLQIENGMSVRVISAPGHTRESVCYIVQPQQYLIVDEGFGYFKIRGFTSSGAEYSLEQNKKTLSKILTLDLNGLCLPNTGVITGNLIRKHINNVLSNTHGMLSECIEAFKIGMKEEEIKLGVQNSFYTDEGNDPLFSHNLGRTFNAIWPMIKKECLVDEVDEIKN